MQAPHARARAIIAPIAGRYLGARLTKGAVQILTAWAWCESSYGAGWTGAMAGSNNWGALQAGSTWKGPAIETGDTKPTAGGKSVGYRARYRAYVSPEAGAEDMVRQIVQGYGGRAVAALVAGDVAGVAAALRIHRTESGDPDDRSGYYEEAGPSPEARELNRVRALYAAIITATNEIDPDRRFETLPNGRPVPPTLRAGDTGRWVDVLRHQFDLPPGGPFPVEQVQALQETLGRRAVGNPDGVAGARTWGHLLAVGAV